MAEGKAPLLLLATDCTQQQQPYSWQAWSYTTVVLARELPVSYKTQEGDHTLLSLRLILDLSRRKVVIVERQILLPASGLVEEEEAVVISQIYINLHIAPKKERKIVQ